MIANRLGDEPIGGTQEHELRQARAAAAWMGVVELAECVTELVTSTRVSGYDTARKNTTWVQYSVSYC